MVKGGGIGGFGGGWARALKAVAGRPVARPLALGVSIRPELPGAPNSTLNRAALQKQVVVLAEAQQFDPLRRDGRRGEAPHQAAAHQPRRQQALERTSRLDHDQLHLFAGALLAPEGRHAHNRCRAPIETLRTLDFAPHSRQEPTQLLLAMLVIDGWQYSPSPLHLRQRGQDGGEDI